MAEAHIKPHQGNGNFLSPVAGDLTVQLNTSQVFALVGCYDNHVSNFQFLLRIPSILIEEEQKKRFLLQKIPRLFLLTSFLKLHVFVHKFWQEGICYNFVLQPENQSLILPKTLHVNHMCRMLHIYSFTFCILFFWTPGKYTKAILWQHSEIYSLCSLIFQSMRIKTRTLNLFKMHRNCEYLVSRLMLHFDVHATYIQQSVLVLRSNYLDEIGAQLPLCHKTNTGLFITAL